MICERCAEKIAGEPPYRFNARGLRRAKVHTVWDGRAEKAFLRLRGRWLERLGFVPGRELEIEEEVGRLVIRAV
jgi:Toxin SymE, type I toxin-antitoxin system